VYTRRFDKKPLLPFRVFVGSSFLTSLRFSSLQRKLCGTVVSGDVLYVRLRQRYFAHQFRQPFLFARVKALL
jgi:hypothetical protein